MQLRTVRSAVLFVVLALAGPAFGQDAVTSREAGAVSAPEAKPFEQIVKLWKANLSEEFLLRKIEREQVVYQLSTDDIIACKAAGVPESVIEAMMKTESRAARGAEAARPPAITAPPVPPAPPVVAVPPVATVPVPAVPAPPSLASRADRSWEGIVRRSPGVVLFRNPWQQGSLSFRAEKLLWRDAGDESKSFALAATSIREHFLVCPKDASSDESCFEWGVKTADGEERFRDVAWERTNSPKPRELFTFLEALYPDLPKARVQVGKKK